VSSTPRRSGIVLLCCFSKGKILLNPLIAFRCAFFQYSSFPAMNGGTSLSSCHDRRALSETAHILVAYSPPLYLFTHSLFLCYGPIPPSFFFSLESGLLILCTAFPHRYLLRERVLVNSPPHSFLVREKHFARKAGAPHCRLDLDKSDMTLVVPPKFFQ